MTRHQALYRFTHVDGNTGKSEAWHFAGGLWDGVNSIHHCLGRGFAPGDAITIGYIGDVHMIQEPVRVFK